MVMKTIILRFSGPLQSWGIGSHFEERKTTRHPTKSAITGLIGAALGYRRDETEKYQRLNELSFGVRIEQKGSLLKDYHIARSPVQTYVTNRYYLQDAVFLAMISHEDPTWIDTVAKALVRPAFPLYMGRRCAPVDSNYFLEVKEDDLLTIIKTYDWQASDWYKKKMVYKKHAGNIILDAYVDANLLDDSSLPFFQRDKAESFDVIDRRHGFRQAKYLPVQIDADNVNKSTKHDAFQGIGVK